MAHHQEDKKLELDKKMLVDVMKRVDICMMTTVAATGGLHSRPMSNNKDVEWDGDTWFFAQADSSQVQEIARNPNVNLAYSRPDKIIFVSVTGSGSVVNDLAKKKELWYKALDMWFPNGPEDPAVVLLRIEGAYAYYWSKEGEGNLDL
jgi:general stress protein 26